MVSVGGLGSRVLERGFILSLKLEKLPWAGGLHDMMAVLPLLTLTERFDGGSGTARAKKDTHILVTFTQWRFV